MACTYFTLPDSVSWVRRGKREEERPPGGGRGEKLARMSNYNSVSPHDCCCAEDVLTSISFHLILETPRKLVEGERSSKSHVSLVGQAGESASPPYGWG